MLQNIFRQNCLRHSALIKPINGKNYATSTEDQDNVPLGPNDVVSPTIRNRNPMNLEKMRIGKLNSFFNQNTCLFYLNWFELAGYKPTGFSSDKGTRKYWNALQLAISGQHTSASVTHWTGRTVCSASTNEWAIAKFLYSNTDLSAVKIVGKVLGQRCLETGISHVKLLVDEKVMEKDKMKIFVEAIKNTGLNLEEGEQFQANHPFGSTNLMNSRSVTKIKPWEIVDE